MNRVPDNIYINGRLWPLLRDIFILSGYSLLLVSLSESIVTLSA